MTEDTLPEPTIPSHAEFRAWPKIARWNRDVIITEKVDGTNAAVIVMEDGRVAAQSRKRIITPDADNFGFAQWVQDHEQELRDGLGVGYHFGEWFGSGIQRGYGLDEKRFALFNVSLWHEAMGRFEGRPKCCSVVPVLAECKMSLAAERADDVIRMLERHGSVIAPGFKNPEGIVIYHVAGNVSFKRTILKDDEWKGKS